MSLQKTHPLLRIFEWSSKLQCPHCGNHFLFNEFRTLDDYDEKVHRRMSYIVGDLICPKCDAVLISNQDLDYFKENGAFPDDHFIMEGKTLAFK